MNKETLKKILAFFLVAIIMLITIRYIKMFPAIMKMLLLAVNVFTWYWAYTIFKPNNKEQKDEEE